METAVYLTLGASLVLFMVVIFLTNNGLLAAGAWASPALLNLSLWTVQVITGEGPGNFIPHYVAALIAPFPIAFALLWRWAADLPAMEVDVGAEGIREEDDIDQQRRCK